MNDRQVDDVEGIIRTNTSWKHELTKNKKTIVSKTAQFKGKSYLYDSSDEMSQNMFELWKNEVESREKFLADAKEGDIFVDIGSCHGSWTIPAAAVGMQVYAFDLTPQLLPHHLRMNSTEIRKRVRFKIAALGDRVGVPKLITEWNLADCPTDYSDLNDYIETTTIDELVKSKKIPENFKYIKIDVEGNELQVLRGAIDTLERVKPNLLIETHDMMFSGMKDYVIAYMQFTDYDKIEVVPQNTETGGVTYYHLYFS